MRRAFCDSSRDLCTSYGTEFRNVCSNRETLLKDCTYRCEDESPLSKRRTRRGPSHTNVVIRLVSPRNKRLLL